MSRLIPLVLMVLFSLACGGGGGSSATPTTSTDTATTDTTNLNRFKTTDIVQNGLSGSWYVCDFSIDGEQMMPTQLREGIYTIRLDGSWTMDMWTADSNGKLVNTVASSDGKQDEEAFETLSFGYIVNENTIKITQKVLYKNERNPTTIGYVIIRKGNESKLLGTYDLTSGTYTTSKGYKYGMGYFYESYTITITPDLIRDQTVQKNFSSNTTTSSNSTYYCSYRDGVLIELNTGHENNIGTYTFMDNVLDVKINAFDGSVQDLTFKKR
jgi:hypothetical protein